MPALTVDKKIELKTLLASRDLKQGEVALTMGLASAQLSRYLNGHDRAPADFEERFRRAVDELAQVRARRALAGV